MAGDETIGEAVRQLGRAVGSLARALVGTVRRGRFATARREPESGPPQAWLDLVAETDPEWLARSRWADRAARPRRERRQRGAGKAPAATRTRAAEPADRGASRGTEVLSRAVSPTHRPSEPDAPVDRGATRAYVAEDAPGPATPTSRGLVSHDPVPAEPAPGRPLRAETVRPDADRSPRLVPVERPREEPEGGAPEAPVRRTSRLLDASPSPHRHPESGSSPLWSSPDPVRHGSYSPLSAHVRELPGTWLSQPAPEPRRPASPPSPSAPTWPQLPPTEGLEDKSTAPRPGLAAVLWDLDGRPDTLTIAQRRS
ncbi:MAG: hypothetical protein ACYC1E_01690 [Propionibacteriaceae bacterium]